ncbi:MAG: acylneuraminate cytidylyltransferase family protein [Candidatus Omnitrophica bacterium]|nr:acylneuraminate cytidylyltransferase family protein [Candidatus Omnitrophota bacterium]
MSKRVVALVPLKKESSRLKNKNSRKLCGKALCTYLFETLKQVRGIDQIYAFSNGAWIKPYLPKGIIHLERDKCFDAANVKGDAIYRSFIRKVPADIYVLAHVTSPFLRAQTIERSLRKVMSGKYDSAMSVRSLKTFAWFKNKPLNYRLNDVPRTQNLEEILIETSGFYMFKRDLMESQKRRAGRKIFFQKTGLVEGLDIDTAEDFEAAEALLTLSKSKKQKRRR